MALKNVAKVRHVTINGTLPELNFYVGDLLREGYEIAGMSVIGRGDGNSLETKYTVMYCLIKSPKDA